VRGRSCQRSFDKLRGSGGEGSRYAHGGDGPEFGVSDSRIGGVDPDGDDSQEPTPEKF
jgi:hypothetical protein